jgi:hypothetical protein
LNVNLSSSSKVKKLLDDATKKLNVASKDMICSYCKKVLSTKSSVNRHLRNIHAVKQDEIPDKRKALDLEKRKKTKREVSACIFIIP